MLASARQLGKCHVCAFTGFSKREECLVYTGLWAFVRELDNAVQLTLTGLSQELGDPHNSLLPPALARQQ